MLAKQYTVLLVIALPQNHRHEHQTTAFSGLRSGYGRPTASEALRQTRNYYKKTA